MDYIEQVEKIFAYFDLFIEVQDIQMLAKIRRLYKNDYNLFGCFLKDYLTIENNGFVPDDGDIYNYFVINFEKYKIANKIFQELYKIYNYSLNYLCFVFEEFEKYEKDKNNNIIQTSILTVNSCFALDCYPFLMELLYKYDKKQIDANYLVLILKSLNEIVLKRFEKPLVFRDIDFSTNSFAENEQILSNLSRKERFAC